MALMLDDVRDGVSPAVLAALARETGESETALASGFTAAIPAIAVSIANRCDDRQFLKDMAHLSVASAADRDVLRREHGPAFSASGDDSTSNTGQCLSSLVGSSDVALADSIANFAGIRRASAASLVSMSGSLVLGYLGRLMRKENLSAAGLADRLRGQRAELAAALPAGFELPEPLRAPRSTVRPGMDTAAGRRAAHINPPPVTGTWTAPLLALIALGIGGVIGWVLHQPAEPAQVEIGEPMATAVGTGGTFTGRFSRALPGNAVITMLPGSAEDRLSMYLAAFSNGEKTINFDRIAFDGRSAQLTPQSRDQIDNIATILRAYPTASVTVAGYSDTSDNEETNLRLSRARAEAVASRLIAAGVPSARVGAAGYGSQKSVADTSTDVGGPQSQRVALEVTVR